MNMGKEGDPQHMAKSSGAIVDYTEGNIFGRLMTFALPFMFSNLLQNLYNMVDMVVVGQFVGSEGLSAVSIGGQAMLILTNIGMGFSNGGQIIISQLVGMRDFTGIKKTIGTLFTTILLMSIVLMIVCLALYTPILQWMNTPDEAFEQAQDYMYICSFGFIFVCGYNMVCAVLRGSGDSKRPLLFIAVSSIVNLVLDLLFVAGMGMEADGAALATVIAQFISFVVAIFYLYRRREWFGFDFRLSSFRVDRAKLSAICKLGIPLAIQSSAIQISQMFVNSYVNTYGVAASAVMGVGKKLQQVSSIITMGVRQAASSMIGQNAGAGKQDRIIKIVYISIGIGLVSCLIFTILALACPVAIFRLFTADAEVLALAPLFMKILIIMFAGNAFNAGYNSLIQGIGNASLSMVIALLDGVVFRIGLTLLFGVTLDWGLTGLFLGNNLAIFATVIPAAIYFHSGMWKKRGLAV